MESYGLRSYDAYTMPEWSLIDRPPGESSTGVAGYGIIDALGLHLGNVSGWVIDPASRVRMIKVSVRGWFEVKEYLVPVGAVTFINDRCSKIHLRELTKRTISKYCITFAGELPEARLLRSLVRYFPDPRPTVAERLEHPDVRPANFEKGLPSDGDSRRSAWPKMGSLLETISEAAEPARHHRPEWTRISVYVAESGVDA